MVIYPTGLLGSADCVTPTPMDTFRLLRFSSFELFPGDKLKMLSPTLSVVVRSPKEKATVNPTAAKAQDPGRGHSPARSHLWWVTHSCAC